MKRSEMVCKNCIKFARGVECRCNPTPVYIVKSLKDLRVPMGDVPPRFDIYKEDPNTHWCAQGEWYEWSERHRRIIPCLWGEWETNEIDGNPVA